ncbi:MAG: hypothetical protein AABZ78_05455 [Chloroflexota bacterium]
MHIYKHRQVGTVILWALGLGGVLAAMILVLVPAPSSITGMVLVILLLSLGLFHSLTVEVNANEIIASFGPGLIRKRFPIGDIHGARIVQNKWYYGWGIRLTPHGWLFNVSGFDAVELELKNKRKFRIGTDDPQELLMAIQRVSEIAS